MAMQQRLTYGLNRSPIRAALQNTLITLQNHKYLDGREYSWTGRYSPILVLVHQRRKDIVRVCASADEEEND